MARQPAILDCDPGHDDAIALFLAAACPELEVVAVTTVAGNSTVENTTRNALKLVEAAGLGIPVARGMDKPLVRDLPLAVPRLVHGESGLDGPILPEPATEPAPTHAVDLIIELAGRYGRSPGPGGGGLLLIPTGPLTNIAMALLKAPWIRRGISGIVLMGGAVLHAGNITSAAEFNIYADPEACQVVLTSGVPVRMVPLDATMKAVADDDLIATLEDMDAPVPLLMSRLLAAYTQNIRRHYSERGGALHDPLAVACAVKPDLATWRRLYVAVETHSELTRGETVGDMWGITGRAPNAEVALDADGEAFTRFLLERVRARFGHAH